ncbi:MAG: Gfo/Idh/MocA family oxidoreductase [Victivallaceae bacterium]|nr:Gfo/Idh/MocA family oxidoreductase [Victivallaceae bacterium]
MISKIKIGIIGCGGMAKTHASRFETLMDRIEISALVDLDLEKAQAVADLLPNNPMVTSSYEEALDVCDAMLVVLPHHLHHQVTIDCLNAGKHVLCEKPLANTEQHCREMFEAAQQNKRVLMVAYCMRFHPLVNKLKEYIDNNTFGKCFQLSIWTEQHTEREPDNWMCRKDQVGGGQLFSHGCHYIDLMLWIMGKPVRGSHISSNLCTPWMEGEGTSNVSIEFEDGKLGYHFGTWGARGSKLKYAFHAHCEKGMLELDITAGTLKYYGDAEAHVPGSEAKQQEILLAEEPHAKPTAEEMRHFINCIKTGEKPLTDPVSSIEGLKVIWQLYEAEARHELAALRGLGLGTFKLPVKQHKKIRECIIA